MIQNEKNELVEDALDYLLFGAFPCCFFGSLLLYSCLMVLSFPAMMLLGIPLEGNLPERPHIGAMGLPVITSLMWLTIGWARGMNKIGARKTRWAIIALLLVIAARMVQMSLGASKPLELIIAVISVCVSALPAYWYGEYAGEKVACRIRYENS